MGRITIFTVDDCIHCVRILGALQDRDIPCTVISLSTHPHRRADMLSLSDRLTVPQLFVNEKHVGGADETLAYFKLWDDDASASSLSDDTSTNSSNSSASLESWYQDKIAAMADPTDPRLVQSSPSSAIAAAPPTRDRLETDKIKLPNNSTTSLSVVEMMETLKRMLPHDDGDDDGGGGGQNKHKSTIFKQSFTGAQAMLALQQEFGTTTTTTLTSAQLSLFGNQLRDLQIWHPLVETRTELTDNKALFRLQCHHTPHILNSYRVWTTTADPDVMGLVLRLKSLLRDVERAVTNETTGHVDYSKVRDDHNDLFVVLEEGLCELQCVQSLCLTMERPELMALGINIYNLFIKFAFMKLGVTETSRARSAFFNGVKFNIAGHVYSFQDWEHGVLRGNRKPPYSLHHCFSKKDPRLPLAKRMEPVDCRLHFALNCGAKSCPPIRTFTAHGIHEELRIVSQAFCGEDENVEINMKKRTLCLNKIVSWYRVDFVAGSEKELPGKIVEFLRGEKRAQLQQLINDGKPIAVFFKKYDWTTNASDFVPFDSAILRADVQRSYVKFPKFKARKKKLLRK
mmetsp:Transcript_13925/g.23133  ORF Transcript_13925/g.23133 Transcript_13925/m.23133 type:complete len:570 (-) Transcript_13925:91-1800(-)|eukprot:CAMPEP_0119015058 /NCGR_PEP_ID=MMETSP1176-20130426/10530_1 /TAXON_ID=265551 /ORGANISM="Synedropsis recta cf, Strain CCMP1620" /LENGTH=569 /DNA_ID=CAMNT_0006968319 /DNA_START=239 /DNA_END=1948 /DNA_ORIENTATION=-